MYDSFYLHLLQKQHFNQTDPNLSKNKDLQSLASMLRCAKLYKCQCLISLTENMF